ncbi:dihydrofolate reductase family protein [Escherichia coli]
MIDSQNRVTPEHHIVQQPGETWFARTQEDSREWPETVRTLLIPEHKGHLDLVVLMMQLGKQQINSILGGSGANARWRIAAGGFSR